MNKLKKEYILVVGGAGYIGSHVNKILRKHGFNTLVLDNLSAGHKELLDLDQEFVLIDLKNIESLNLVFTKYNIIAVMHFGAVLDVGESVIEPEKYFYNNVVNSLNLLHIMKKNNVKLFIFSSSASVYGSPQYTPIDENHRLLPLNPYGQTKAHIENVLNSYANAYDFNFVSLRYFNAAGASVDGTIGEWHEPETHLIPLILDVAIGKKDFIKIFGDQHATHDGTAIRDYVHVDDIAEGHVSALKYLLNGGKSQTFNLGHEKGYSVLEVIKMAEKITTKQINYKVVSPRLGEASILVADASKIKNILGWKTAYSDIETIISSAWKWHQRFKNIIK